MITSRALQLPATALAFLAYSLWSVGDAVTKLLTEQGASTFQIMAFQGLGAAFLLFIGALRKRNLRNLKPIDLRMVMGRGVFSVLSSFCFILAYTYLPLAQAYIVEFMSPFIIVLAASLFLKEPLSLRSILLILIGFSGCLFAIAPHLFLQTEHVAPLIGYIAALGATLSYSGSQIISRYSIRSERAEAILFLSFLMTGVVGLVGARFSFANLDSANGALLAYAISKPFFSLAGSHCMLIAHKKGTAAHVSPFHYWQLVMAALLGGLIWHDPLTGSLLGGAALIITSGILIVRNEQKIKETCEAIVPL